MGRHHRFRGGIDLKFPKEFVPDSKAKGRCTPKPSKFHADILRIGDWQWTSSYEGDLVAKFYYSNHRLVWEMLSEGLKTKIEIDWENISSLKFTCPEGGLGTLEIMRPIFLKEANLQLGRNTAWMRTVDFTGGQATIHRKHILQCESWILKKHIVTLLSRNHRLYSLSQENTMQNPCFENLQSESEVLEFGGHKLGVQLCMPVGTNFVGRNHDGSQSMITLTQSSAPGCSSVIAPSGSLEHRNMFNISSGTIMNDTKNGMAKPRKPRNLLTRMGASANSQVRSEDVRNLVNEIIRLAKRPATPLVQQDYSVGSSSLNLMECAFNNTSTQTFEKINSSTLPRNGGNDAAMAAMVLERISHDLLDDIDYSVGSSSSREQEISHYDDFNNTTTQTFRQQVSPASADTMVLEKISHDLLDNIDMEPTGMAEDAMVVSSVNSLSNLLQQDPPAPPTVKSSQAQSHVFVVAPDAGSSGGRCNGAGGGNKNTMLPSTAIKEDIPPCEEEQIGEIEMDLPYLSEIFKFIP